MNDDGVVTVGLDRYEGEPEIGDEVQRYLVLRQFISHEGVHYMGEKLPKKVDSDPTWNQSGLLSLVAAGFLAKVASDDTYDRMPAHVYNEIRSLQELEGVIAVGESPVTFNEWVKATEVSRVEDEIAAEEESKRINAEKAQERGRKQTELLRHGQVDPRPVVVPHRIPSIDAMKPAAEQAARETRERQEKAAQDDESGQVEHKDLGTTDVDRVQPSTERDGADVNQPVHENPTTKPATEGPDADEATVVVPSTDDGVEGTGPVRDYAGLTKPQLQEELTKQGKPTSGNKDELVERLKGAPEA